MIWSVIVGHYQDGLVLFLADLPENIKRMKLLFREAQ
jgi:hypothetical protein